jgi:hypothetical protein
MGFLRLSFDSIFEFPDPEFEGIPFWCLLILRVNKCACVMGWEEEMSLGRVYNLLVVEIEGNNKEGVEGRE